MPAPYNQHIYLGEFATDALATANVVARGWDDTGKPRSGMLYYNTTLKILYFWNDGCSTWQTFGGCDTGVIREINNFAGTVLDSKYKATVTGAGTVTILVGSNAVIGGAVRLSDTGAAGAQDAQLSYGTNRFIKTDSTQRPEWKTRVRVNRIQASDGTRLRVVLHNSGGFNATGDWLGLEFDSVAGTKWRIRSTKASAAVVDADSGVVVSADTWYLLHFKTIATGDVEVRINGTVVGTISANNVTTALLEPLWYVDDGGVAGGNAINYEVDFDIIEQIV